MEHLREWKISGASYMTDLNEQIDNCLDYIEFAVSDIERSKSFYGKAFGWEFTDFGETYCEFSDGRMKGGFHTLDPVQTGGPLIVIYHDDFSSVQSRIVEGGGMISKETFAFPGGERFHFKDPDGYELAVWRKS